MAIDSAAASSEQPPIDAPDRPHHRPPPRVLVAEDDEDMRSLIVEELAKDGYRIDEVADGGRLLVALTHALVGEDGDAPVDLVVSDVRMPICTGMQLLEQMRAAAWKVPVILMTAYGDAMIRERAVVLGAMLFDKPFVLGDLRVAVAALLGERAMHSP